jgi:sulfate transport system permease protein
MIPISLSRNSVPKKHRLLPGFGLSLGMTLTWLSLIVLLPLSALATKSAGLGLSEFFAILGDERVLTSLKLTFGCALVAAVINLFAGTIIAWTLVRYPFPGRGFFDTLVDMPFALPTAVAGISLTALYGPEGWFGAILEPLGIQVAYSPIGITLAMAFVGFPFAVRSVQPILEDLGHEPEEASATLGASRWATLVRVVLPNLIPALGTAFALAFARGVGEYGSIVFISGNMPYETEILPLLIVTQLEQYQYAEATALALIMLLAATLVLFAVQFFQSRISKRYGL